MCFFCLSFRDYLFSSRCPRYCSISPCGGQTLTILGSLGPDRQSSKVAEGEFFSPLQNQATLDQVSFDQKWICTCNQADSPDRSIACTFRQRAIEPVKDQQSSFLQPLVLGPQTQQQMEANLRPQHSNQISQGHALQDGNPGTYKDLSPTGGVGRLLSPAYPPTVQEISQDPTYQFKL